MNESSRCVRCGSPVSQDEAALTRKMINRGTTDYLCLSCLAGHFLVSREVLLKKIQEFREMGCTLFDQKEEERS